MVVFQVFVVQFSWKLPIICKIEQATNHWHSLTIPL